MTEHALSDGSTASTSVRVQRRVMYDHPTPIARIEITSIRDRPVQVWLSLPQAWRAGVSVTMSRTPRSDREGWSPPTYDLDPDETLTIDCAVDAAPDDVRRALVNDCDVFVGR